MVRAFQVGVGQQHRKLLTAQPGHHVGLSAARVAVWRPAAAIMVAHIMAMRVIDAF